MEVVQGTPLLGNLACLNKSGILFLFNHQYHDTFTSKIFFYHLTIEKYELGAFQYMKL